jgi:flavin reductase (DIM6/NTAB) family NADH-FMN oxidoreductase RutF
MFYEPNKRNHGLSHDPFKALVAPRPIGWITSMSAKGEINLAPYSYFNAVLTSPPMVMFASDAWKDTIAFVEETQEFVCSLATWELRQQVNATSAPFPRGVNEMQEVGLDAAPSVLVRPPRVKASPCALECRWLQTIRLHDMYGTELDAYVALGQVIGVHIEDRFIERGLVDTAAMHPIGRAGYHEYFVATLDTKFSLQRPTTVGSALPDDLTNA